MKTAIKSFVLILFLFVPFTSLAPSINKPVLAAHALCGFKSPPRVQAGASVPITEIVGGFAGDVYRAGIVTDPGNAATTPQGTWTKPAAGTDGTITLTAPATPGDYKIILNNDTQGAVAGHGGFNLCVSNNAGNSDKLVVIPATVGTGTGTGTGTCATGAVGSTDAIDTVNKCLIEADKFDDKGFVKNQFFGLIDAGYLGLSGKSILTPEINGVTANQGALAATGSMVAMLYNQPPASGVQYMASQFEKLNPVQPAYAQGIGYQALEPVQTTWEAFRNLSYIGFVIVFVIIGFMIMFRAHISAQAVATVQDSLPRIVIALFLVTFSYAIAGFIIDLMFLFLNIIINALKAVGLLTGEADKVFTKSVFGIVWGSWKDTFGVVADAMKTLIDAVLDIPFGLDKIIGTLGGGVAALVVGIAMLFIMFRVFFMLLIAYATIIILTIFAPFFFLFQALPGNNGAQSWFKQMTANVAVFPAVALMFILAAMLGGIGALGGNGAAEIGSGNVGQFPLLAGDLDPNAIGKLIAIGILLMTPSAADMVKKAIGAQGGIGAGAGGAMASLGAGAGVVAAGARRGYGASQEYLPQQLDSKSRTRFVNPAYWNAKSQIHQEERAKAVKEKAGTWIGDRTTKVEGQK